MNVQGESWANTGLTHLSENGVLLSTGKVLLWGAHAQPALWDPPTNILTTFEYPDGPNAPFNSGHTALANGTILMVGGDMTGHRSARTFDPTVALEDAWSLLNPLTIERWYPTVIPLGSGAVLVASGDVLGDGSRPAEVYDPSENRWVPVPILSMPGALVPSVNFFPAMFLLPSGRIVLLPIADSTPTGSAILSLDGVAQAPSSPAGWGDALLPGLQPRLSGMAVMLIDDTQAHPTAQVLAVGNGGTSELIDFTDEGQPTVVESTLNFTRHHHPGTVALPTGAVLVLDGDDRTPLPPEIFENGQWVQAGPAPQFGRQYHGVAVLLPDGRVLLTSSGSEDERMELYSPWYMSEQRPAITSVPEVASHRSTVAISTSVDVSRIASVSLIRPTSVTHGTDAGQRYVKVKMTRVGDRLHITMPSENVAPPGFYVLHVVDDTGVPSPGRFVRLE